MTWTRSSIIKNVAYNNKEDDVNSYPAPCLWGGDRDGASLHHFSINQMDGAVGEGG